jgi:hypothetical protein
MQNDNLLEIGVDMRFILKANWNKYACVMMIIKLIFCCFHYFVATLSLLWWNELSMLRLQLQAVGRSITVCGKRYKHL